MKKWLCLALATLLLLCVGCGKKDATTKEPAPEGPQSNRDLKVEDCYTYTENKNGTYSYTVEWRGGGVLLTEQEVLRPASFTVNNEDVLMIHGENGVGTLKRWAKFCDIEHNRVSETFAGYLAAEGTTVAFLDQRTNAHHVFVCDVFQPDVYIEVCTLEGLTVAEGSDPVKDFALSEEGVLSVTYATADGDKTVTVDLKKE